MYVLARYSYHSHDEYICIANMIITWHGEGCFRFQNGDTVLLTDIPQAVSGIVAPRFSPSVYVKTITALPLDAKENEKGEATIRGGGEYDVKGIKIKGVGLEAEASEKFFKTIYRLVWEDITFGLLGHIAQEPSPLLLEEFEDLDVLIGPGGGDPFLGQEKMVKLIKQLHPKIFIPSFYKTAGLKRKSDDVKKILDDFNGDVEQGKEKFVFKKKDLADIKKTKVICFKL